RLVRTPRYGEGRAKAANRHAATFRRAAAGRSNIRSAHSLAGERTGSRRRSQYTSSRSAPAQSRRVRECLAAALTASGRLARPVVDQTGLGGRFDFTLEWIPDSNDPAPADLQEETTFQEALQDQLGLKLKSTKIAMDTLVIDHVARPSEN